jgi:hypothetical protein
MYTVLVCGVSEAEGVDIYVQIEDSTWVVNS